MASASQDRVLRENAAAPTNELANALRALTMDAVQAANSGHPGAPMGMAEMAVALWQRHLKHDPRNPQWFDRDRFVLSNGHASMLLYALLHLSGYDLPLEELKRFRQLHSKTPGHPEVGLTPGIETTTGPLGQGLSNAVGMALAEKLLGDEFNRDGYRIVDHCTYVFLGDGCLMEGISHEVCSLAGTLQLNKLIALYDDNGISIDGAVAHWFSDNTAMRFRAYGWNVIDSVDGHDVQAVDRAIAQAKSQATAPTLIICKTAIGRGSPNREGTAKSHGEPLGSAEIEATRAQLGWHYKPFELPAAIKTAWNAVEKGATQRKQWRERFEAYRSAYPKLADEFERRMSGRLPTNWNETVQALFASLGQSKDNVASRKASQMILAQLAPSTPEMLGGSADLTGSNLTDFPGCGAVRAKQAGGRYINYGVREFGMAAIMNGVALHGGYIPYGGTFLTFSDYSRNAIRMAALMKQRVIHVFTHDSIGLGEDGPTHQSVEHAASLRLIPNLDVWRPGDVAETACAWISALQERERPTAFLLSRQNLPAQERTPAQVAHISRGGYVLREAAQAQVTLIGTGSELGLATAAAEILSQQGVAARVVSMPSTSVFDRQSKEWKKSVLGSQPRIAVEAGITAFWGHYGCQRVIGVDRYGESAPAAQVYAEMGVTVQAVVDAALEVINEPAIKS